MEGVFEEAVIGPDGETVKVTIHGVKGGACASMQDKYSVLGPGTEVQKTAEFYEESVTASVDSYVRS